MVRAPLFTLMLAAAVAGSPVGTNPGDFALQAQELCVVRIKAVVTDRDGRITAVPRHALLISDEPPTATPRRIVTGTDGTATVRLRPGAYTIESDQPIVIFGKSYQWTQHVVLAVGQQVTLDLTSANAEIETPTAAPSDAAPTASDPIFLLPQWEHSILPLWTPTARASGFVIDARGLIATNQRVVADATAVEVQLSPEVKVAARVLAADAMRDVAILWINPAVVAAVRPLPLPSECAPGSTPPAPRGRDVFAIGAPLRGPKRMTERSETFELRLPAGSEGGPVFTAAGVLVGLTSTGSRIVPIAAACEAVASAEMKMKDAPPPSAAHLPVEPARPFPVEGLKDAAKRRAGSLNPAPIATRDFEVSFLTPVQVYAAQQRHDPQAPTFGNWWEYMADVPPVLAIRVTPKMVERFWGTIGRAAAITQGVTLPAMKHVKTGFLRMQAFCGETEVTPIHPFIVEQPISDREAVATGLYVFDPAALGPQCGAVKLVLYSEKEPAKGDTRVIDSRIIEQIWQDFEPHRR